MKCFYGCGNDAKFVIKNGNRICSKYPAQCPVNKKKNSNGLKKAHKRGNIPGFTDKHRQTRNDNELIRLNEKHLKENSSAGNKLVKKILVSYHGVEEKCSECGQETVWNGKPLSLHLDHINGISSDNRKENLRFLCPNCHTQTETWCGKNKNNGKKKLNSEILLENLKTSRNIRQALLASNLAATGPNYQKCYELIYKHEITHLQT